MRRGMRVGWWDLRERGRGERELRDARYPLKTTRRRATAAVHHARRRKDGASDLFFLLLVSCVSTCCVCVCTYTKEKKRKKKRKKDLFFGSSSSSLSPLSYRKSIAYTLSRATREHTEGGGGRYTDCCAEQHDVARVTASIKAARHWMANTRQHFAVVAMKENKEK